MTLGSFIAALALVVVAAAREPILFATGWMLAGLVDGGVSLRSGLREPLSDRARSLPPLRDRPDPLRRLSPARFSGRSRMRSPRPGGGAQRCSSFAVLHLLICMPIHRFALPAGA